MPKLRGMSEDRCNRFDALLGRVKSGQSLKVDELEEVREAVRESLEDSYLTYTGIHILGCCGDFSSKEIIARHLADVTIDEGTNAAIAIKVLGTFWKIPDAIDEAETILRDYTAAPLAQISACYAIASLGREHPHLRSRSARLLLSVLDASRSSNEFDVYEHDVEESSYRAIFDLLGLPIDEWPPVGQRIKKSQMREDVIVSARRVAREDGPSE